MLRKLLLSCMLCVGTFAQQATAEDHLFLHVPLVNVILTANQNVGAAPGFDAFVVFSGVTAKKHFHLSPGINDHIQVIKAKIPGIYEINFGGTGYRGTIGVPALGIWSLGIANVSNGPAHPVVLPGAQFAASTDIVSPIPLDTVSGTVIVQITNPAELALINTSGAPIALISGQAGAVSAYFQAIFIDGLPDSPMALEI